MALWRKVEIFNVKCSPNPEFFKGADICWTVAHQLMTLRNITGDMWVVAIFLAKIVFNHCFGSRTELSPQEKTCNLCFSNDILRQSPIEICILLSAGWRVLTNFIEVVKYLLHVEGFERWQALGSFSVWSMVLFWCFSIFYFNCIIYYDSDVLGS